MKYHYKTYFIINKIFQSCELKLIKSSEQFKTRKLAISRSLIASLINILFGKGETFIIHHLLIFIVDDNPAHIMNAKVCMIVCLLLFHAKTDEGIEIKFRTGLDYGLK